MKLGRQARGGVAQQGEHIPALGPHIQDVRMFTEGNSSRRVQKILKSNFQLPIRVKLIKPYSKIFISTKIFNLIFFEFFLDRYHVNML